MIEPSLDLQTAVRTALIANTALTDLVIPASVFDGRARPEEFPCIIIGDGQTVLEANTFKRSHMRVYLNAHVWTMESGLENVKAISGAVTSALAVEPTPTDHALIDFMVTGTRFMRDPASEYGHAIVQIEALLQVQP